MLLTVADFDYMKGRKASPIRQQMLLDLKKKLEGLASEWDYLINSEQSNTII